MPPVGGGEGEGGVSGKYDGSANGSDGLHLADDRRRVSEGLMKFRRCFACLFSEVQATLCMVFAVLNIIHVGFCMFGRLQVAFSSFVHNSYFFRGSLAMGESFSP